MLKRFIEDRLTPVVMAACFLVMLGNVLGGMVMARGVGSSGQLPSKGTALPNVTFSMLEDSSRGVGPAQLLGRDVLLTFWSTDCTVCVDSLHAAAAIESQRAAGGLIVLAVNTDDAGTYLAAREQGRSLTPELVPVYDAGASLFRYWGKPRWVLLDRNGNVAASGRTTAPSAAELDAVIGG